MFNRYICDLVLFFFNSEDFVSKIICGKFKNWARKTGGTLQLYRQVSALAGQFYGWRQKKQDKKLEASLAPAEFGAVAKADQKKSSFLRNTASSPVC